MTPAVIAVAVGGAIVVALIGLILFKKLPRRLRVDRFVASWKELQVLCRDKDSWPLAITQADKLLDAALKKRKLKGTRMGERMVSAQRLITGNDELWFAHNLAKKLRSEADYKLKESEVKKALLGFRQALKDIGALPSGNPDTPVTVKEKTK